MKFSRSVMTTLKHLLIGFCLCISLAACQAGVASVETISPQVLLAQLDAPREFLILDVRSEAEYADGHVPGAINIPYREIPNRLAELADFHNRKIVVYCEVGVRAGIAEHALEQAGFQQVIHLDGHMRRWRQEGLPTARGALSPAT